MQFINLDVTPISRIHPPITTTIQKLPFEELQWEVFEYLCLKRIQIEFGVNNCEKRGIKGQNQQGIDILARLK